MKVVKSINCACKFVSAKNKVLSFLGAVPDRYCLFHTLIEDFTKSSIREYNITIKEGAKSLIYQHYQMLIEPTDKDKKKLFSTVKKITVRKTLNGYQHTIEWCVDIRFVSEETLRVSSTDTTDITLIKEKVEEIIRKGRIKSFLEEKTNNDKKELKPILI